MLRTSNKNLARRTTSRLSVILSAALPLAAFDDAGKSPLAFAGGGFIFNYRIAEVFYGVSLKPQRRIAPSSVLEGEFENPAGGPALLVRETLGEPKLVYGLRTPAVKGVVAGRPYKVVVRLLEAGRETGRIERTITSDLNQDMLPDAPLTVGPGYTPTPDAGTKSP
jgi:hypothetical protein